jgi:hypothetical protein
MTPTVPGTFRILWTTERSTSFSGAFIGEERNARQCEERRTDPEP